MRQSSAATAAREGAGRLQSETKGLGGSTPGRRENGGSRLRQRKLGDSRLRQWELDKSRVRCWELVGSRLGWRISAAPDWDEGSSAGSSMLRRWELGDYNYIV